MGSISRIAGLGIAITGDDIDTDQILPARYLKAITFQGMEAHVFADSRAAARAQGNLHPLDTARAAGGGLLVVNRNFGCGSSREHAPQGLHRFGITAVIGESFGEIFAGNCVAVGMPCVQAPADVVWLLQDFSEAASAVELVLDLETLTISAGGHTYPVTLAEGRRRQFLEGSWDSTTALLRAEGEIERVLARLAVA